MKKLFFTFLALFVFSFQSIYGQIKLGLIVNEFAERVEVYAIHEDPLFTSKKTFLATGQVTLVVNNETKLTNVKNINGLWSMNSRAEAPIENPTKDYIFFGFDEYMNFPISGSEPILLFTAEYTNNDIALIQEGDPFLKVPNSLSLNPGNELSMVNLDQGMKLMAYGNNYSPCGVSSLPCGFEEQYAEALRQRAQQEQVASQVNGGSIMASDNEKGGRQ